MELSLADLIEKEENLRKLRKLFLLILAITVIADFFVERHAEFVWQQIPGFASFYGFISCIFIIVFSKWIGHRWLMEDEDYWDRSSSGLSLGEESSETGETEDSSKPASKVSSESEAKKESEGNSRKAGKSGGKP